MTRKRFIKLLMSHGKQRNEAQAMAFYYNLRNTPYAKAYSDFLTKHSLSLAFRRFGECANKAGISLSLLNRSFNNFKEVIHDE